MIEVWTDGSCLQNPGGRGGWAWVRPDGMYGYGAHPSTTNNRMELQAAIEALRAHLEHPHVVVYSDSQYVVKAVMEWRLGWQRKGYAKVKNPELIRELHQLFESFPECRFEWVRGHAGCPHNDRADELAGLAARQQFSEPVIGRQYKPKPVRIDVPEHLLADSLFMEVYKHAGV